MIICDEPPCHVCGTIVLPDGRCPNCCTQTVHVSSSANAVFYDDRDLGDEDDGDEGIASLLAYNRLQSHVLYCWAEDEFRELGPVLYPPHRKMGPAPESCGMGPIAVF